ncbi:MAG: acetyl/propionyl-CoA carboxylase subuit alpha [Dehalococcoidia bacterium]
MFRSVLIANRGEIAVRIVETLRRMGIRAVAVASIPDRRGLAARMADAVVELDGSSAAESYLDVDAIIRAAKAEDCQAIHPGYGFLSERADFAERCEAEGIVFVGPPPGVLRALGDKGAARRLAQEHGVPVVPGWDGEDDPETLAREAARIGYPVMVKARGGGGGRGMRQVFAAADLREAIEGARREALAAFGDGGLLIEKLVRNAHHVEVQVVADRHGNAVHLGERDCSVQRRHQKLIEESPSPVVDERLRAELTGAALRLAGASGYVNAGTFEFLVTGDECYFIEVNPRLQVEHPVTEAVTGLDLVELQVRVAAGEALPLRQEGVRFEGHAIEVRVNAEDPWNGFMGGGGRLRGWDYGGAARIDAGYARGDAVPGSYDSLLAKVIGHGANREEAIARTQESLEALGIEGVTTNAGFVERILGHADFARGAATVDWLDATLAELLAPRVPLEHWAAAAAALAQGAPGGADPWQGARWIGAGGAVTWLSSGPERSTAEVRGRGPSFEVLVDGQARVVRVERGPAGGAACRVGVGGPPLAVARAAGAVRVRGLDGMGSLIRMEAPPPLPRRTHAEAAGAVAIVAPLAGTVASVRVVAGDAVEAGQLLMTLDAMKMEHRITAPEAGVVREVCAGAGDIVREGDRLVEME